MHGSLHFQVYEHNLKRILLLDWLRGEQIRRRVVSIAGDRDRPAREAEPPYWVAQAEVTAQHAG